MQFFQSPAFYYAIVILLILIRLVFDIPSLGRSFWTDEVWVANSIVSPSLRELFYPDTWLQTTAPLFLLLVRATSLVAGISETTLRLVPYLMAMLAALGFTILVRRVLHPAAAILATALFFFTPQLFVFARLLKQYSAELAFTVAILLAAQSYLISRSNPRFLVLLAASLAGLGFGYGLAFLLPSLLILIILPLFSTDASIEVKRTALLQAACFALCTAATLLGEYYFFVLPNSSDVLTKYWQHQSSESLSKLLARQSYHLFQRSLPFLPVSLSLQDPKHWLAMLAILSILAFGVASSLTRSANTPLRGSAYATIFSLLVADLLGIYPAMNGTIFFTLPLSVFLLADGLQSFWQLAIDRLHWKHAQRLILAICLAISLALGLSFKNPPAGEGEFNFEDYQSAMKYLKTNAGPVDIVFIHGASAEAFRFYSKQLQWAPYRAFTADSGWPCCARNRDTSSGSNLSQLQADLEIKLPWPVRGRLWLLYTNRMNHYQFQGFDERPATTAYLKSKACRPVPGPVFLQVGLSAWDCP